MGIKGLRDLLKRELGVYEVKIPMKDYEDKKIVVDASLFICMYKAARKEKYEEMFMLLFSTLLEHKIQPIFVFDGKSPKEKSNEKRKRAEKKDALQARVVNLENSLERYHESKEISKELQEVNDKVAGTSTFSIFKVQQYVAKLRSNILNITEVDFKNVQELLTMFGIPYITAEGEAEILCAELVKQGLADAVMTKDTDVLACCVPVMLYDVDLGAKQFIQINLDTILEGLELDRNSFLDLCIMCGTDFNDNIPLIGPVKSLNYIKQHKNIETIGEVVTKKKTGRLDTSILAYETTRKLFRCDTIPEKLETPTSPDFEMIDQRISDKNLSISKATIKRKLGMDRIER